MHPDLKIARYGRKNDGDRFVGFWLALVMEGRQKRLRSADRKVCRILDRFWAGHDVQAALATAGVVAFNEQLQDAAAVYFTTCLTDPQYSNTLLRTNRIEPEKLRDKMARDAADTLAVLAESGGLSGHAVQLPALLTDGFLDALAPQGAQELGRAISRNPSAMRAMEMAAGA